MPTRDPAKENYTRVNWLDSPQQQLWYCTDCDEKYTGADLGVTWDSFEDPGYNIFTGYPSGWPACPVCGNKKWVFGWPMALMTTG